MDCLICQKQYRNVGAHVVKTHKMTCNEYRLMFNLKLMTPLVDPDVSEMLSASALQRMQDPEWLAKCIGNVTKTKGGRGKVDLPPASKKHLVDMNRRTGESYRKQMIPVIRDDFIAGMPPLQIQKKHGVSPMTLRDWVKAGFLPERKLKYVVN